MKKNKCTLINIFAMQHLFRLQDPEKVNGRRTRDLAKRQIWFETFA